MNHPTTASITMRHTQNDVVSTFDKHTAATITAVLDVLEHDLPILDALPRFGFGMSWYDADQLAKRIRRLRELVQRPGAAVQHPDPQTFRDDG